MLTFYYSYYFLQFIYLDFYFAVMAVREYVCIERVRLVSRLFRFIRNTIRPGRIPKGDPYLKGLCV